MKVSAYVPALLLVLAACAPRGGDQVVDPSSFGTNLGPEPSSTAELRSLGGATYLPMDLPELRQTASLVVEATVVDVHRSRLNTADGLFPSLDELRARGLANLDVLTDVDLEVIDVVDVRPGVDAAPRPGERFTITVGGGEYTTTLDVERARAIGMTDVEVVVPPTREPLVCPSIEPDCGPPEVEVETPVTAPADLTYGRAPGEILTEGDRVVLSLVRLPLRRYEGGTTEVWGPVHPVGVLRPTDDGRWKAPGSAATYSRQDLALVGG